ncbi:MAG: SPOR domain-containing protein [Thermodesulfobacteriota bacterium]
MPVRLGFGKGRERCRPLAAAIVRALKAGIVVEGQMLALYTPAAGKPRGRPPRRALPASKSLRKKGYSVQVASLRFSDDADDLAVRLRKKGYDAYVVPANIRASASQEGKNWRLHGQKVASLLRAAGLKKKTAF